MQSVREMRQQVLRTTGSSVGIRERKETLREDGRKKTFLIGNERGKTKYDVYVKQQVFKCLVTMERKGKKNVHILKYLYVQIMNWRDRRNRYIVILNSTFDIYIYISYRSANLQTLHFKYLFNKYTY